MTPEERARQLVEQWSVDEPLAPAVDWATGGKTRLVTAIAAAIEEEREACAKIAKHECCCCGETRDIAAEIRARS
jgi:hypothetical protein